MTLAVVSHSTWRAEELHAESSLGFDLPNTSYMVTGEDGIWCPGSIASMMYIAGDDWQFEDCKWWNLPASLLGRNVKLCNGYTELMEYMGEVKSDKFVKLARHKYDFYPAKIRSSKDIIKEQEPSLEKFQYIVSDIVDIKEEHRVFVIDGKAVESSCYRSGDIFYGDSDLSHINLSYEGMVIAEKASHELSLNVAVIDIAILSDGCHIVVEGNPPWCSSWYSVEPETVIEAVKRSQGRRVHKDRLFLPDIAVRKMYGAHMAVRNHKK